MLDPKKVLLISPRGFCAGVARAVKTVEDTLEVVGNTSLLPLSLADSTAPLFEKGSGKKKGLEIEGMKVYVKHEIVHNKHVVADLEKQGVVTVEKLSEVPDGATVVFSAHGSPPENYVEAKRRGMRVIDATCPLVTKVHLEARRFANDGYTIIYIGHRGHIEGLGVLGEVPAESIHFVESVAEVEALAIGTPDKIAYLTQTTLSLDETDEIIGVLRKKFPHIVAPPISDICFATTNRQSAVKELADESDIVLIFGSKNSSNSNRLREVAEAGGKRAYLIDDMSEVEEVWLSDAQIIGISAGASAPERVIDEAVAWFRARGYMIEERIHTEESLHFAEPVELTEMKRSFLS